MPLDLKKTDFKHERFLNTAFNKGNCANSILKGTLAVF